MRTARHLVWMLTVCVLVSPIPSAASRQDSPSASTTGTASPEIETFVREALRDRLAAGDIPDIRLMRRTEGKPILVRADLPESRTQITSRALPSVADTELVLMTLAEAQREVTRTGQSVHLLAVDHVSVNESTATIWLGVDLLVPTGSVKMCCCERDAHFRKQDGKWVFERWGTAGRCY